MEEYPGNWITAPTDSITSDTTIFVTGRTDVSKFKDNPRFCIRIDVTMPYNGLPSGLPDKDTSEILKEITDRLVKTFTADPVAVLTGIYTGDNRRDWTFYTPSTHIFQRKFNQALDDMPTFPIRMEAQNDPDWEEYQEMIDIIS